MAQHPVRPGHHCGHLHGRAGQRLRAVPPRQPREPRRAGLPAGPSGGGAAHEDAPQGRGVSGAQRRLRLVRGAGQRVQLHRVVPTGAVDQGRVDVRDQRPGGEVQREELRAVPPGGGAARRQVRDAGPHADPTGGGDRGGDPGPGDPGSSAGSGRARGAESTCQVLRSKGGP